MGIRQIKFTSFSSLFLYEKTFICNSGEIPAQPCVLVLAPIIVAPFCLKARVMISAAENVLLSVKT